VASGRYTQLPLDSISAPPLSLTPHSICRKSIGTKNPLPSYLKLLRPSPALRFHFRWCPDAQSSHYTTVAVTSILNTRDNSIYAILQGKRESNHSCMGKLELTRVSLSTHKMVWTNKRRRVHAAAPGPNPRPSLRIRHGVQVRAVISAVKLFVK
jgi:hypothetical protein